MKFTLALLVSFTMSMWGTVLSKQKCSPGSDVVVSADCQKKWQCVNGRSVEMPQCPQGLVFSRSGACVRKHGQFDDCSKTKSLNDDGMSLLEMCMKDGNLLIPHPDECQLYYNCSRPVDLVAPNFEPFLEECTFPEVFDEDTLDCMHYKDANCRGRTVHKWICNYRRLKCPVASCRPCYIDNPSCVGLDDGVHPDPVKGPVFYMECENGRTKKQGMCDQNSTRQMKLKQGKCQ